MATEHELSEFLKSVEKRAFKRTLYHVRNEESALDVVQDSMIKLVDHYGDKPPHELPMLFHRILSNTTFDWFRRQKTRNALFTNMGDFLSNGDESLTLLDRLDTGELAPETSETTLERAQILAQIETEIQGLPGRQREAFLMRYWEELDLSETAAAMGCSQGSVKTHCSRAIGALRRALQLKGIRP